MPYELSFTPNFYYESMALPRDLHRRVAAKLDVLRDDPGSANGDAKKLKGYRNVYRVRVGGFRILYSIGGGWVKLLSVRKRDESTYEDDIGDIILPDQTPDSASLEPQTISPVPAYLLPAHVPAVPDLLPVVTALPIVLTAEILEQLQIPAEHHPVVTAVQTADDLLDLPIPASYAERILDHLFPPPIGVLERQPEFVLAESTDIERFAEESLSAFLLRLSPEQEALRSFGDNGPALVKGGPGSGKSTLALYRVERLHRQGVGPLLFTTYTNALLRYSDTLLTHLLNGPPAQRGVTVSTVDAQAMSAFARANPEVSLVTEGEALALLHEALSTTDIPAANVFDRRAREEALKRLDPNYLLQEFDTVIDAWEIGSVTQYREHPRRGRLTPLRAPVREAIWAVYERWRELLRQHHRTTWALIRREALVITRAQPTKPFAAVIIDEAQDLTPVALRFLLALTATPYYVYLTADASQSIYGRTFSWKAVTADLNVTGRTVVLKRNYRNTEQILNACIGILGSTDAGDSESIHQEPSMYRGDVPTVALVAKKGALPTAILDFFRQAARVWRLPIHSSAVLCPNARIGREIARGLSEQGVPAAFLAPKEIDIDATHIKVMTLHAAKGLEFPFVAIVGLDDGVLPALADDLLEDERSGVIDEQRRLFYVGCSRAMRALMVCGSRAHPSPFLTTLLPPTWQRQELSG